MVEAEFGYSSICEDGNHVLLWDFDVSKETVDLVYRNLKDIQREYNLTDIYLFTSRNGYNAICLDKLDLDTAFSIKCSTPLSDSNHNVIGKKRNSWVLRIGEDKKLLSVIHGNSSEQLNSKSNAHRLLLFKVFNLYIMKDIDFDDSSNLKVEAYIRKEENSSEKE